MISRRFFRAVTAVKLVGGPPRVDVNATPIVLLRPSTVAWLPQLQLSTEQHVVAKEAAPEDVRSRIGSSGSRLSQSRRRLHGTTTAHFSSSSSHSTTQKESSEDSQNAASDDVPQTEATTDSEAKLEEDLKELREKHDELMDKYRRSIAETDNMRKRLTKQIDDAKIFGIQGFCKDLLEVADVLGKAIENVSEESLEKESQYLRDMFEGLKLTESQLMQVFQRHGLVKENPINEKFDPNKHEAMFQIPAPDKEPNTVLDVQKVGYLLHGRTIRPALVGVSKK